MTLRSLGELGELTEAEQRLLASLDAGDYHQCGDGRLPDGDDPAREIRAALLRLVLLGGVGVPRLHEKGLRLTGALVHGRLDLEGCHVRRDLALADCRFDAALVLQSATIDTLLLDGSVVPGIVARRLKATGSVYLRATEVEGAVDMLGARLEGECVLDGSSIARVGHVAFDGAGLTVHGDLTMRGTRLKGGIKLNGATLGGDLVMVAAAVERTGSDAIAADSLRVGGDVVLHQARITGASSLVGARIGGDLRLDGGTFERPGEIAIMLNRAVIEGALFLRHGARIDGALSLNGAQVGALVDDPASWPSQGDLLLNRFRYGGILGSPTDAGTRLDWLARQEPSRWGEDFWPQPYEQLSTVLSNMGHHEDANRVLFAKERLQRRARRARAARPSTRFVLLLKDLLLWLTVGYGLQPLLAFCWLGLFWLTGVGLLAMVQANEQLRPNVAVLLRSPEWVLCGRPVGTELWLPSLDQRRAGLAAPGESQLACFRRQPEAGSLPRFNVWMYSIESLVPGLDAGQRNYWSPDTRFTLGFVAKMFEHVQVGAGFVLGLLAVAGFSGLVKSK